MRRTSRRNLFYAAAVMAAAVALAFFMRRHGTGVAISPHKSSVARYEKTVSAMGTLVTVSISGGKKDAANAAIDRAIGEIGRLERLLSYFNAASDVSRVNDAPAGTPVKVSGETIDVLQLALGVSRATGGALDVSIGPLVSLWRETGRSGELPTEEQIQKARALVSYEKIAVDPAANTVTLPAAGMWIDLSAVAKGYIAGRALDILRDAGAESAFVNAGGDIAFLGANPDGSPWRIGVTDPRDDSRMIDTLHVSGKAVVTSGNYEQYSTIAGKRYSHIIDPHTGWPLEGSAPPASVTTLADDAGLADAWATALCVLGRKGTAAAEKAGVDFIMFFVKDGKISRVETPGIARCRQDVDTAAARHK